VESGRLEIYVTPFPPEPGSSGEKRLISPNGGTRPRWSADGKEIFYIQFRTLVAVGVETADRTLRIGEPKPVIGPLSILGYVLPMASAFCCGCEIPRLRLNQ
jgi:hypothetical protein